MFRGQGRSQSFSSTITAGGDDDPNGSKVEVLPVLREVARHPGCIEEDVIEEEAVDDTEVDDIASNPQTGDHQPQQAPFSAEPTEIPGSSPVLPIHDCCESCTRNTLLGMKEDYVPPFSESAIRKIQREREEHEQNMQVVADAAAAAGAALAAGARIEEEEEEENVQPKRIWDGKEWVLETSDLPSNEQRSSRSNSAIHDEVNKDEVDSHADSRPTGTGSASGSRRGSGLFDTDKAKSMMVDEVEYVRRMRGQVSNSNIRSEAAGMGKSSGDSRSSVDAGQTGIGREDSRATAETSSPDHGVW
jgi:hypothetical protein